MTVGELEHEISMEELMEWMAYFKLKAEAEKKAMQDAKNKKGR